jgi:sigma-B regulation protein RsbU (phosphoserine phosphatase)
MDTPSPPKCRVLIAEDSRIQAKILEQFLIQAGYQVRVAQDGRAALRAAQEDRPDVVVSDIEMPHMNGYELCRAIKQTPGLAGVPVVLLSTLADAEDIIRGLDAGADNYVTKPYDPKYLISRLAALLETPMEQAPEDLMELAVTLGGRRYHVKSGRQQILNLLVSTFENAVAQNRELQRSNEMLSLAKEKLIRSNAELERLNLRMAAVNERMERDLRAAARIQQSLLPDQKREVPSASVAWKYQPHDELAGDFLNYFMLDERHLALFVVDVSGHGAAASLLAVAVGRALNPDVSATSLLARFDPFTGRTVVTPPAAVLDELNRRFQMTSQGDLYFTITYGVLDTATGDLRYVSAGHPPLVHVSAGQPSFLPGKNFAVGWIDDPGYEESRVRLAAGDRVYFYSDGINEAINEQHEQLGNERLLELIGAQATGSVDQACESLLAAVNKWCEPKMPSDDVSIMVCQFDGARVKSLPG